MHPPSRPASGWPSRPPDHRANPVTPAAQPVRRAPAAQPSRHQAENRATQPAKPPGHQASPPSLATQASPSHAASLPSQPSQPNQPSQFSRVHNYSEIIGRPAKPCREVVGVFPRPSENSTVGANLLSEHEGVSVNSRRGADSGARYPTLARSMGGRVGRWVGWWLVGRLAGWLGSSVVGLLSGSVTERLGGAVDWVAE